MTEKERTAATVATTAPITSLLDAKVLQILQASKIICSNLTQEQINDLKEEITDSYLAQKIAEDANAMPGYRSSFVSAATLLEKKNAEIPKLFDPIIPQGVLGVLAGSSDAGKSMFLRQLAICCATGRDWLGYEYRGKHRGAIYCASEDDENATSVFLNANNNFFKDSPENWSNFDFTFITDDIVERLDMRLAEKPVDLIVMDCLQDFFNGKDTSDNTQVRAFYKPYDELCKKYGCTIIFLHHISKASEDNVPSKGALHGSQAIEAKPRLVMLLVGDKDDDSIKHLCIVKQNYLGPEWKRESIDLRFDKDSFTFQPTGLRTPLEQLGYTTGKKRESKAKGVDEYATDEVYQGFVGEFVGNGKVSKTALMKKLKEVYNCRQDKAYDIINYMVTKRWLQESVDNHKTFYENVCAF